MKKRLYIIPFLLLAACVEPSPSEMSLSAAETFCAPRAQSYARRPLPVLVGGTIQVGLLAEMVGAGFPVLSYVEERETLESLFLNLTQGIVS